MTNDYDHNSFYIKVKSIHLYKTVIVIVTSHRPIVSRLLNFAAKIKLFIFAAHF